MATYENKYIDEAMSFKLNERYIYGSSRLGLCNDKIELFGLNQAGMPEDYKLYSFALRYKQYELSNHLGNVLSTITDSKIPISTNQSTVDYFLPDVVSSTDYSAFGAPLDGRTFFSEKSPHGFNGALKENDIAGQDNDYEFKYRMYDARLGRFWQVDPLFKKFPYNSNYAFAENMVIEGIELEGLEVVLFNKRDRNFYNAAIKDKKESPFVIDIYGHGCDINMGDATSGVMKNIEPKDLNKILIEKEVKWRNKKKGSSMVIILHSCNTGKIVKDENGNDLPSFAQNVSALEKFKNTFIVAPDEQDRFDDGKEIGPEDDNGNPGHWNVFYNGKLVGSLKKDEIPKLSNSRKLPWKELMQKVKDSNNIKKNKKK